MARFSRFWNNNQMVIIHAATTGDHPRDDSVIQVSAIPLDSHLEVLREPDIYPLNLWIKPKSIPERVPNRLKESLSKALQYGEDYFDSPYMFDKWFKSLGLKVGKQIWPVFYDLGKTYPFIMEWLSPSGCEEMFTPQKLCLCSALQFLSVRQDARGEPMSNPHWELVKMIQGNEIPMPLDAKDGRLKDALMEAEVIRKLMNKYKRYLF